MSYLLLPVFDQDEKVAKSDVRKEQYEKRKDGSAPDWRFAAKMLFNGRGIGTPMATSTVAHLTVTHDLVYRRRKKEDRKMTIEGYMQEAEEVRRKKQRRRFVLRQVFILLVRFLATCLFYDQDVYRYMPDHIPWSSRDFAPEKAALLRRLLTSGPQHTFTTRQGIIRIHQILEHIVPDYLILSSYHDILAILAVLTGLDELSEWPPLFGSITQAYSVRRYWSRFWHHLIYRCFSAWATLLTRGTGLLRQYSRYLNNTVVFVMSGFMHALVDWKLGNGKCGSWSIANWFLIQMFAIVFEEAVQHSWKKYVRRSLMDLKVVVKHLPTFERAAGFVWVFFWFFWSIPKTSYAEIYCEMAS